MTPELCFAIPGDIASLTGGYAYDRRLIEELGHMGWPVRHLPWGSSFPFPDVGDLATAARSLARWRDGSLVMIDGLAYGALPELAEAEGRRLRLIALVHHPLAVETDLSPAKAALLFRSERRALSMASAVIVTSHTTAERLIQDYSVPRERLAVALPGSDPAMQASDAAASGGMVNLLSIATVTHRKGHDLLVEAPEFATKVRRQIAAHGLESAGPSVGKHVRPLAVL